MKMDLSGWALRNRSLVYFFIFVLIAGGLYSCYKISKLEDPEIRVKQALVIVTYPGATASEIELQVADPLEKAILTIKNVDNVSTTCYNDMCLMSVELLTTTPDKEVDQNWDILRRKVQEAYIQFPQGASMPMVKDDFDTLFGLFYALSGDGMDYRQLSDYADLIKRQLINIDGVTRIDIYGMPQECIDISLDQSRMDRLGVLPIEILATLNGQNQTVYAGYYNTPDQRLKINIEDKFRAIEDIRNTIIQGHEDEQIKLGDIANVEYGYASPIRNKMTYNGEDALGICIGTKSGMDVLKIGEEVTKRLRELEQQRFPAGLQCTRVFYQPDCVESALTTFAVNLAESILIVIVVLMIFMGFRSGLIIGISLLVTVLGSFVVLYGMDGTMQRVSLGAFILAMGMLVDNAIVIIDGILVDLDSGDDSPEARKKALTAIGKRTAMPLLGATLIAILAFFPIYLSPDTSGVYVRDLFIVLAVSLLLSWILALLHVPLMANRYLKTKRKKEIEKDGGKIKESVFHRMLGSSLRFSLNHRILVMGIMVALLGVSIWGFRFIRKGFFPDMEYSQLYIEYKLPEGSSSERTLKDLREMERVIKKDYPEVTNITASVGGTPCRYNLVRTVATPSLGYGELIVDFDTPENLEAAVDKMQAELSKRFPDAYVKVKRYNIMFKKYPIEVQFTGPDPKVLHSLTDTVMAQMHRNPNVQCITTDWEPESPVVSIDYNQTTARRAGITRKNIALSMLSANEGIPISTWHDGPHSMKIYLHTLDSEGNPIDNLDNVNVAGDLPQLSGLLTKENLMLLKSGKIDKQTIIENAMGNVPLLQISDGANIEWIDPVILRYNGSRSQRAQCSPAPGIETETARRSVEADLAGIELPDGYSMQWQGEKYASDRTMKYLFGAVPLGVILILIILIWLFRDYRKPIIVLLCIPFMFIGIVPTMILSGNAFTFVAIVGTLGLMGMMLKNGIVLMDEITLRISSGEELNEVLIGASKSRLRPVMMASLTTILGMIPLLSDVLFGSLSACIMGGLAVGSITILIILPILYSILFPQKKSNNR